MGEPGSCYKGRKQRNNVKSLPQLVVKCQCADSTVVRWFLSYLLTNGKCDISSTINEGTVPSLILRSIWRDNVPLGHEAYPLHNP